MKPALIEKYAKCLLHFGVHLQPGQYVILQTETGAIDLAREITKQAYEMGAREVIPYISDPEIEKLRAKGTSVEDLRNVMDWQKESLDYYLRNNGVQMGVMCSHPALLKDVPSDHLMAQGYAKNELRNVVRAHIHDGSIKWTGSCWPSLDWAKQVYPELSDAKAYEALENALLKMMYIDEDNDPLENWQNHCTDLKARAAKLNAWNFKTIHEQSELGTDITIDLVEGHIWQAAQEKFGKDEEYVANMPTEEVFTAPDYRSVNGIAYASYPLLFSGKLVTDFSIKFKDGKAVDCHASANEELLRNALFANEQTRCLGEIALVSKRSPIKQMGRIFYNGLIDENAACHLAFGASFPECIVGGDAMNKEDLLAHGVNVASSHNDFMVGTEDMKITGITHDGKEVTIMEHGDFVL